jgi:6-pyruvoyltetrahydropterin/6-carboxytetrahydropterin synthase
VFGRCANRHGHGHNYTLEVTVAGEPDPVTGFVVDLKWLKEVIEREVLAAFDHRHLNLEVPEFETGKLIPTSENIAIAAWNRIEPAIAAVVNGAGRARLSRVRLYETPEIFAEYRGGV